METNARSIREEGNSSLTWRQNARHTSLHRHSVCCPRSSADATAPKQGRPLGGVMSYPWTPRLIAFTSCSAVRTAHAARRSRNTTKRVLRRRGPEGKRRRAGRRFVSHPIWLSPCPCPCPCPCPPLCSDCAAVPAFKQEAIRTSSLLIGVRLCSDCAAVPAFKLEAIRISSLLIGVRELGSFVSCRGRDSRGEVIVCLIVSWLQTTRRAYSISPGQKYDPYVFNCWLAV
jgi:hypothetical protein